MRRISRRDGGAHPPRRAPRAIAPQTRRTRAAIQLARVAVALGLVAEPQPTRAQDGGGHDGGGLVCTPLQRELQTRRPIPFDCRADQETMRVSLRYREHPAAPWQTLELEDTGGSFRATLPCEVTMNSGRLELFVVATDGSGDPVDTLGSKNDPVVIVLNPESRAVAAYPGKDPPERCEERVICPPDFPGCDDPDRAPLAPQRRLSPRHWVSLHLAADVGFHGGSDVCTSANTDYDCFASGSDTPYPDPLPEAVAVTPGEVGDAYPGTEIPSGPGLGTTRLLLGYERRLDDRVSFVGRLGYAFGGGPTTLEGRSFLPVHVEARLAWWPSGLDWSGVRPFLHFGAGLAEVDVKKGDVQVKDCTGLPERQAFLDCIAASGNYTPENDPDLPVRTLDAYRKLGDVFATAGGGVLVPIAGRTALQASLSALLLFPSVGVVLQPSLGIVYGL